MQSHNYFISHQNVDLEHTLEHISMPSEVFVEQSLINEIQTNKTFLHSFHFIVHIKLLKLQKKNAIKVST